MHETKANGGNAVRPSCVWMLSAGTILTTSAAKLAASPSRFYQQGKEDPTGG